MKYKRLYLMLKSLNETYINKFGAETVKPYLVGIQMNQNSETDAEAILDDLIEDLMDDPRTMVLARMWQEASDPNVGGTTLAPEPVDNTNYYPLFRNTLNEMLTK